MKRINETSYLNIRALAYSIDHCLEHVNDSNSVHFENALMLSAMLIQEIERVDERR